MPGCSASVTASATWPRSSCEVSRESFASASSSARSSPSSETRSSESSSLKKRSQALDAGDALLGRDPLLRLGELVGPVAALRAQHGRVVLERRVGEQPLGDVVVERAPLEVEEEELGLDLRVPLAHLLDERAARLVGVVGREAQPREGLDARRDAT